jgi:hypothetical protein
MCQVIIVWIIALNKIIPCLDPGDPKCYESDGSVTPVVRDPILYSTIDPNRIRSFRMDKIKVKIPSDGLV